jgi:ankyrin repeat protein
MNGRICKIISVLFILLFVNSSVLANVDRWDDNKSDWSDLMLAIYNGKIADVKKLIDKGENPNYSAKNGMTPLEVAIRIQNSDALNMLLATGNISLEYEDSTMSYFILACMLNSKDIVESLLDYGCSINDTLYNGYSALMAACSFGSLDIVKLLLKKGVNIEQKRDIDGITALMMAAFDGNLEKVRLLLKYNANKDVIDKKGNRAFDYVDFIYPYKNVKDETKFKLKKLLK